MYLQLRAALRRNGHYEALRLRERREAKDGAEEWKGEWKGKKKGESKGEKKGESKTESTTERSADGVEMEEKKAKIEGSEREEKSMEGAAMEVETENPACVSAGSKEEEEEEESREARIWRGSELDGYWLFGLNIPQVVGAIESQEASLYHAFPPPGYPSYQYHQVQPRVEQVIRVREERVAAVGAAEA